MSQLKMPSKNILKLSSLEKSVFKPYVISVIIREMSATVGTDGRHGSQRWVSTFSLMQDPKMQSAESSWS